MTDPAANISNMLKWPPYVDKRQTQERHPEKSRQHPSPELQEKTTNLSNTSSSVLSRSGLFLSSNSSSPITPLQLNLQLTPETAATDFKPARTNTGEATTDPAVEAPEPPVKEPGLPVNTVIEPTAGAPTPVTSAAEMGPGSTFNSSGEGDEGKRFFCKTCNKGFTRKHNMISHELIHSQLRPHQCGVCKAEFRRIHDLKRHEKLHSGEKPYQCPCCPRKFARPDSLIRHQNLQNACPGILRRLKESGSVPLQSSLGDSSALAPLRNLTNPKFYAAGYTPAGTASHTPKGQQAEGKSEGSVSRTELDSGLDIGRVAPEGGGYYNQPRNSLMYRYPNEEFILLLRYQDLVAYTQLLEDSLNKMNSRVELLEEDNADLKIEKERNYMQDRHKRHKH